MKVKFNVIRYSKVQVLTRYRVYENKGRTGAVEDKTGG